MCRYRRRTCELSVRVHTSHSIGHTVRCGTCGHVIGVQGTAGAAARCYREVSLAGQHALLLVGSGNGVLEAGGVGRVTGDRYVDILFPHDCYALAYIVGTVAANLRTQTVRVGYRLHLLHFARVVIELGAYIREAVDTRDDLCCILAQTVQDNAQRVLTHAVGHFGDLDSALGSCERLVTCKEREALRILAQQTCCEVAVADTYLTVVGDRSCDAECLQALADSLCGVGSRRAALLDCDSRAYDVCPLGILEADRLSLLAHLVGVDTFLIADALGLLDALYAVLRKHSVDVVDSALVALK